MSQHSEDSRKALTLHLKKWQEIGNRMNTVFNQINKQQKQLQKITQPIAEMHNTINNAFEPFIQSTNKLNKTIVPNIKMNVLPALSPIIRKGEEFRKVLEGMINPVFEELHKTFQELPPRTQKALLILGQHGWYLDIDMAFAELWKIEEALIQGNAEDVEDTLVNYFQNKVEDIEQSIVEKFPSRKSIISAAFDAHHRGVYELSIPVFLAQTDGICKEISDEYLFLKQNRKPRTAIYVNKVASDAFTAALLSPLTQTLPISASESERDESFNELNRHLVLHGESLDYGNKVNSLKTISLINYVTHILKMSE